MTRFVLDTNVLVSIALPNSHLDELLLAWQRGRVRLLISREIFEGYLRVLTYPKFRLTTQDIQRILEREVQPHAEEIVVTSRIHAVKEDPSDDKFLAYAVDGKADWIISGDRHLLRLNPFRGVRIGRAFEFLQAVSSTA